MAKRDNELSNRRKSIMSPNANLKIQKENVAPDVSPLSKTFLKSAKSIKPNDKLILSPSSTNIQSYKHQAVAISKQPASELKRFKTPIDTTRQAAIFDATNASANISHSMITK